MSENETPNDLSSDELKLPRYAPPTPEERRSMADALSRATDEILRGVKFAQPGGVYAEVERLERLRALDAAEMDRLRADVAAFSEECDFWRSKAEKAEKTLAELARDPAEMDRLRADVAALSGAKGTAWRSLVEKAATDIQTLLSQDTPTVRWPAANNPSTPKEAQHD